MKRTYLLATAALAATMALSSCAEDNGNVWTDEDVVTRGVEDVTDGYSMLDNGLFSLAYPKDLELVYSTEKEGIVENKIVGEDILVETTIIPFDMVLDKMMELLVQEELSEYESLVKSSVTVDGIKGVAYSFEENGMTCKMYWFRNGNRTIGFIVGQDAGCQTEFSLEESLRWKAGSDSKSDWLSEAKRLADYITRLKQDEGYRQSYLKVVPEESLFIISYDYERDDESMEREEAKDRLNKMVNTIQAMKGCAEHGYTFVIKGSDAEGTTLFSHQFTPDNYQIDNGVVLVD